LEERARERVRLARDLHDTLLQGVQGLVLRFHFATEQLPLEEPARAMLSDALDRADQVIQEGREKVIELRSEVAPAAELEKHLKRTAEALQVDGPARISVVVSGEPRPLFMTAQDELYSIGREALTNAARHSQGTQVLLELSYAAQYVSLCCTDNGCGVSEEELGATQKRGHWGLIGMHERARSLGCKLEFASVVGKGTKIAIRVPAKKAYADSKPRRLWPGSAHAAAAEWKPDNI
jgi:signal transduction histidine kinase